LGKPAGLATDGLLNQPDVFDFMAKRLSLDTELVLVIEEKAEVKSRPLDMIIAPPDAGCICLPSSDDIQPWRLNRGLPCLPNS
jgi:hypothetical protein